LRGKVRKKLKKSVEKVVWRVNLCHFFAHLQLTGTLKML